MRSRRYTPLFLPVDVMTTTTSSFFNPSTSFSACVRRREFAMSVATSTFEPLPRVQTTNVEYNAMKYTGRRVDSITSRNESLLDEGYIWAI